MDSDFDWSDIVIPDLTFDTKSFLSLPYSPRTRHELAWIENHRKAYLIPAEVYSEIFLYTVHAHPDSRVELMLVCRHWHEIMLSTPGIHSQLRIRNSTKQKDVERFGRRWYLDVTIDMNGVVDRQPFNPEEFFESFTTAAQAASRWRSLELVTFPPPGDYKDLQIMLPLQRLETFKIAPSCNLGNFLEPLMTKITTTVTPRLTVMEVLHPDATPYLVQPTHFHIFSSLTILRLICRRMQNPVDILPYLHKLETFEAHYLLLPIYSPSVDLPMIQTLHFLRLKAVSVQWMSDQIFPALKECSIIFPHHADAIHSVYMPSCSTLKYDSNNLGALEYFHLRSLDELEVKCGQWQTWRGTLQLATLHPVFASQSLTVLHLQIKCSEKLLVHMLELVPALKTLWLGLSSPHALSSAFFLAFAAGGVNATEEVGTSSQAIPRLCKELIGLHLHYKRWLRGPERKALIPAFGEIVESRRFSNVTHFLDDAYFSLYLSIGESPKSPEWEVLGIEEKFGVKFGGYNEPYKSTFIGFSGPYGIVTLVTTLMLHDHVCSQHFTEVEYFTSTDDRVLPIEFFLPCHSLKEVRIPWISLTSRPNTPLSTNFPFFHAVKVLSVYCFQFSFLAGQAIHNLERYKEQESESEGNTCLLPEMPVCTRLVVKLSRLASLRLPRIRELGVFIECSGYSNGRDSNGEEPNSIWGKHIAVNSNLSELKLLQICFIPCSGRIRETDLTQILRFTPALETLIIDVGHIFISYTGFFQAFVPIRAQETAGLYHSSGEGQTSGVLCPKLESLQIQGISLTEQPELMPVLKEIVTLRTTIGSPLKSFTFYVPRYAALQFPEQKWELIGKDRRFTMEEIVPAQRFKLDI